MFAHDMLKAESANAIVAGGMESMTNAPHLSFVRKGVRYGQTPLYDHMAIDGLEDAYERGKAMGVFAEHCVDKYKFSREAMDQFAIDSTRRSKLANEDGSFDWEMAPVTVPGKGGDTIVKHDEQPFKAKLDKIPGLKPAFKKDGAITAATSSSISDGAAALVLMRESTALQLKLAPIARIVGHSVHAQAPSWFTTAPVGAIEKLLKKTGWNAKGRRPLGSQRGLRRGDHGGDGRVQAAARDRQRARRRRRARPPHRRQRCAHRRHAARRAATSGQEEGRCGALHRRRRGDGDGGGDALSGTVATPLFAGLASLGLHDLWLFSATVLVMNLTPGPDLMFTLARTLQHGVRGGAVAALGIGAGCVVHTLAAAFGLAALLAASASAFGVVKWVGAGYLVWLAISMLRADRERAAPEAASTPPGGQEARPADVLWRVFRQGALTNALNPKVAIFFLALLPQFIDASSPHKTLAFMALGAWFIAQGLTFLVAFAIVVAPLRRWNLGRRAGRALRASGGVLFLGLAARLALAERH